MRADNRAGKYFAVLLAAVAVMAFRGECFAADPGDVIDSVLAQVETAASTWGPKLRDMSERLFWCLALIGLVWNMGGLLFGEYEIHKFFSRIVHWLVVTGSWLFLLRYGPILMHGIIESFNDMGEYAGGGGNMTPSGIMGHGVQAFGIVLRYIQWPSAASSVWNFLTGGGSATGVVQGFVPGLMTIFIGALMVVSATVIGCTLALKIVNAYVLVYTGYFYFAFSGLEWTRPMSLNYLRSVLVAGAELLATLLVFTMFSDIFGDLTADFVMKAAMAQEGVRTQDLIVILMAMVMCAYFILTLPRVLGKICRGVVTGAPGPVTYRNALRTVRTAAGAASGGVALAARLARRGRARAANLVKLLGRKNA